ncbi:hypothetical protein BDK51DRAFT_40333 [Blyttiomyces helicus]|uniref:Uncharacterized protein n=1 Tax=Blyttiomyces helicus TaxID=388810 RepID=A0A4P9W9U7_9FUNG|nr:hypothetical protein BDK51DRAFT_40333 [Blyttiomyces helicus]|eukprot:RKO87600.1 hypothetical protein BDK51DRAFT_40333 [Blyttiomyces helicus]
MFAAWFNQTPPSSPQYSSQSSSSSNSPPLPRATAANPAPHDLAAEILTLRNQLQFALRAQDETEDQNRRLVSEIARLAVTARTPSPENESGSRLEALLRERDALRSRDAEVEAENESLRALIADRDRELDTLKELVANQVQKFAAAHDEIEELTRKLEAERRAFEEVSVFCGEWGREKPDVSRLHTRAFVLQEREGFFLRIQQLEIDRDDLDAALSLERRRRRPVSAEPHFFPLLPLEDDTPDPDRTPDPAEPAKTCPPLFSSSWAEEMDSEAPRGVSVRSGSLLISVRTSPDHLKSSPLPASSLKRRQRVSFSPDAKPDPSSEPSLSPISMLPPAESLPSITFSTPIPLPRSERAEFAALLARAQTAVEKWRDAPVAPSVRDAALGGGWDAHIDVRRRTFRVFVASCADGSFAILFLAVCSPVFRPHLRCYSLADVFSTVDLLPYFFLNRSVLIPPDMSFERDALKNDVFPYLDLLCRQMGFEFLPIDMRNDEITTHNLDPDHMLEHVTRANLASLHTSTTSHLVLLVGNSHARPSLPSTIPKPTFDTLFQTLGTSNSPTRGADLDLLLDFYAADSNIRDGPPLCVLQPIDRAVPGSGRPGLDARKRAEAVDRVAALFREGAESLGNEGRWEWWKGVADGAVGDALRSGGDKVTIRDLPGLESAATENPTLARPYLPLRNGAPDAWALARLADLLALAPPATTTLATRWDDALGFDPTRVPSHASYLAEFADAVCTRLATLAIEAFERDGPGMGGDIGEAAVHLDAARRIAAGVTEGGDAVAAIGELVAKDFGTPCVVRG